VVALDTNVLVYAETPLLPQHARAAALLQEVAEGATPWALPWPCVYEFMRVVTHPRAWKRSMPLARARSDLRAILASPSLVLLSETERHWEVLDQLLAASGVTGNLVFDAHIAALCIEHGVSELLTADADFRRFPGLRVRDPFAP
jgi:toxin-antitoxin system PIN domain toxin